MKTKNNNSTTTRPIYGLYQPTAGNMASTINDLPTQSEIYTMQIIDYDPDHQPASMIAPVIGRFLARDPVRFDSVIKEMGGHMPYACRPYVLREGVEYLTIDYRGQAIQRVGDSVILVTAEEYHD